MKTVAICNSCMQDIMPDNFFEECIIDEDSVTIALLDTPDPDFKTSFNQKEYIL